MRDRPAPRLVVGIFLTATALCFSRSLGQTREKQNETVWFVLQEEPRGKLSVDPIGKIVGSKMTRVPTGCDSEDSEYKKFDAAYLQPGQVYSVSFGGAPAGIVGLRRLDPNFGNSIVEYDGFAKIHGHVMALATNAKITSKGAPLRKAPSQQERELASQFARQKFAENGISAELLSRIKNENLTLTFLSPAKSPSLIGSFFPLDGR
jgi:hypothetical protein